MTRTLLCRAYGAFCKVNIFILPNCHAYGAGTGFSFLVYRHLFSICMFHSTAELLSSWLFQLQHWQPIGNTPRETKECLTIILIFQEQFSQPQCTILLHIENRSEDIPLPTGIIFLHELCMVLNTGCSYPHPFVF
jgi:hypothetical protein